MYHKALPPPEIACDTCGWPGARFLEDGFAACLDCLPIRRSPRVIASGGLYLCIMKIITLEEALAKATPGKLRPFKGELPSLRDVATFLDGTIIKDVGDQPTYHEQQAEAPYNAALLAHCRNVVPQLVEALEEYNIRGDFKNPLAQARLLRTRAALVAAKKVEVPE